ncbi:trichoplein keratin filament-binding protein-like [Rhopilema esculentum]|uniref:trichoplein keratin filament-binding protein-like n=1 Tax=Rhopilema esculentum TaxID=499914 RepID=UPI0031E2AC8D
MALPTLQPFWMKNYKNTTEALMVKRNQDQSEFREKWDKNSQFFKKSEVETAKQTGWTSNQSFQRSMNAVGETYRKTTKQLDLEKRRNKLAELLSMETDALQKEMRQSRLSKAGKLIEMKDRADELRDAKEERRKQIAEEKLYQHWKENEPDLRKVQSTQVQQNVIRGWGEQITERREIAKTARDEDRRLEHMMEIDRLRVMQAEKKRAEERKMEEIELKSQLQKQMEELRIKDEEAQMLKREEEGLVKQRMLIDGAEEKRRQFEEQRRRQEYGRVLVRQYKAQLRRKSKQVQDALELDLKILEDLAKQEQDEMTVRTSRREKAKTEAEKMRQVVQEQLKLEKAREAELDQLYQEEAARQWQKRESEWERERIARERLMQEVLHERQKQVDDRIQIVLRKKQDSIAEREDLIRQMEDYQQSLETEKIEEENRKQEREREISEQITARSQRRWDDQMKEQELLDQKRREEEAYKKLINQEVVAMTARDDSPRTFRRRKFAFE